MASKIIEYDTMQDKISKLHLVLPFFLTVQTVLEIIFFLFLITIFFPVLLYHVSCFQSIEFILPFLLQSFKCLYNDNF